MNKARKHFSSRCSQVNRALLTVMAALGWLIGVNGAEPGHTTKPAGTPLPGTGHTHIAIVNGRWQLNGRVTYPGTKAEGLLLNVRMVNSTFEDRYRPEFDARANTDKFVARITDYRAHGIRAITLCLQGGSPGYEGALNSGFNPDGSLRAEYLSRIERVLDACDQQGMAVILGCYYQRQSKVLRDDAAIRAGIVNVVNWLRARGLRNVMLEIANEYPHNGFAHEMLKSSQGIGGLIRLAKQTWPELLVSASGYGDGKVDDAVAGASDFLLIHFNSTPVEQIPARITALQKWGKPIVCNEDDKTGQTGARAAEICVANGASWGLMLKEVNQYSPFRFNGAEDDPVIYSRLTALTSERAK